MAEREVVPESPKETQQEPRVIHAQLGEMNEIESMCPECQRNGITRLMFTKIPHFREVIVSGFECPHCGEKNNEVQFGGKFGEMHQQSVLKVLYPRDMNRQVVKSEYATITIPELELELPPQTQKGVLNTVEGLLVQTIDHLQLEQPVRRVMEPEVAAKIDEFCRKLEVFRDGNIPFTLIIDDPAGNSFVESIYPTSTETVVLEDPQVSVTEHPRTTEERELIGLAEKNAAPQPAMSSPQSSFPEASVPAPAEDYNTRRASNAEGDVDGGALPEVLEMDVLCSACKSPGTIKMHQCDIPHFKETLIMCFTCDKCGYKTTEIKGGGAISKHGLRITLKVLQPSDLNRDILKSNTASLTIPEIELELTPGTLGGFFSTVEGVLSQVHDRLSSTFQCGFTAGDSGAVDTLQEGGGMGVFLKKLEELRDGFKPFTLVLDDALGNVYIQNPRAHLPPPENEDPQLIYEKYDRTWQQDEDLGLHDMNC